MSYDSTWATVDLDAIEGNIAAVESRAGAKVMAVVKADAYGHGAVPVARLLEGRCAFFGVSSLLEGLELRRADIRRPILILGATPPDAFPEAIRAEIRPTIFTWEDAQALSAAAVALGVQAPFHIAVDTGMSRIGVQPEAVAADLCVRLARLPGLRCEGLFSHFATADEKDLSRARAQAERFAAFDAMLRARGLVVPLRHLNNSAGIMNFPTSYEMVRSGIVTYGLYPSGEVNPAALPLTPALSWYSRVTYVKTLPAGRQISYGGTFTTVRPTRVATISVGYADGYRRALSGGFAVLIRGRRAPILGRVCMDQLMADVTAIPGVQAGDTVTLVGRDGGEQISVEEIAEAAGTFNYEFVCGISRRVPRYYLRDGQPRQIVRYLLEKEEFHHVP